MEVRPSTALSPVFSSLLQVMPRLRVGIGRPTVKTTVERHVLGRFSSEEKKVLDSVLVQSVDLVLSQLSQQDSQLEPRSPSSPAGGRHAAENRKKRECSASPAEHSAAAQSWRLYTRQEKTCVYRETVFILWCDLHEWGGRHLYRVWGRLKMIRSREQPQQVIVCASL